MVIPFEPLEARLRRQTAERAQTCLADFCRRHKVWASGAVPLSRLCTDAGDALDWYAVELFDVLLSGAHTCDGPAPWVLDMYHEAIAAVAAALRDAVGDAAARHAVAQVLQARVLRIEVRARRLAARLPPAQHLTSDV